MNLKYKLLLIIVTGDCSYYLKASVLQKLSLVTVNQHDWLYAFA